MCTQYLLVLGTPMHTERLILWDQWGEVRAGDMLLTNLPTRNLHDTSGDLQNIAEIFKMTPTKSTDCFKMAIGYF